MISHFNPKLVRALEFAAIAHKRQKRKSSQIPYLVHLLDVASILIKEGADEDLVVAGLLHDSVEDFEHTGITSADVEKHFGKKILNLVLHVTEDDKSLSWDVRKQEAIDHMKKSSRRIQLLKCADVLANLRDTFRDQLKGPMDWGKFSAPGPKQKKYFVKLLSSMTLVKNTQAHKECVYLVKNIKFGA